MTDSKPAKPESGTVELKEEALDEAQGGAARIQSSTSAQTQAVKHVSKKLDFDGTGALP